MSNAQTTTVTIGTDDVRFKVDTADLNKYINNNQPDNKVAPAYNLLNDTIVEADKELFKKIIMRDGLPNGPIVMQIAGVLMLDAGAGVAITVKKSQNSPTVLAKTATAS
jgi:hypothetical protein